MTIISANRFALLAWYYLDAQKKPSPYPVIEDLILRCGVVPEDVPDYKHACSEVFFGFDDEFPKSVDGALVRLERIEQIQKESQGKSDRPIANIDWENLPFIRHGWAAR